MLKKIVFSLLLFQALSQIVFAVDDDVMGGGGTTPTTVNLVITSPTNGEMKCGDNADQSCSSQQTKDATVKLTAKPSAGYQFKSWGGACASQTTSTCSLTMSTDKTVSVIFEQIPATNVNLTITTPTNGEIKCGDNADQTCSTQQVKDATVKLTAKPNTGYQFKSWGGDCASQTTSTCSLTMSTDKTVSVTFTVPTRPILEVSGIGAFGDVAVNTEKIETIIVKNTGTADISVNDLKLGISGTGFSQSTSCNATLVKTSGQCAVDVSFKPTQIGDSNGTLTVTATGADGSPQTVTLTGKGTAIHLPVLNVTPTSLSFSSTTLSQKVTVNNATDNTTLKISGAILGGLGAAKFSNTGCENAQLTTNTCEIIVTFTDPKDAQTYTASLDITSDGGIKSVSLTASPPLCSSSNLLACTQDNCTTLGNGVWNTSKNICEINVEQCSTTFLSACKDQTSCQSINNGVWEVTTNTCKICDGSIFNGVCISTDLMKLKLDPVLEINSIGQQSISSSVFLGGVGRPNPTLTSIDFLTDNQNLTVGEIISINGMVVPKAEHVGKMADILVVGLYLPNEKSGSGVDACDPSSGGNYYVNTHAEDIYCFWTTEDGHNYRDKKECNSGAESSLTDAKILNRRAATGYDYWKRWEGKLDENGLPALATGKLTNQTNLTGLYSDKLNYTGHVCINFGYRLKEGTDKGTIVFNGAPIKYRVSP